MRCVSVGFRESRFFVSVVSESGIFAEEILAIAAIIDAPAFAGHESCGFASKEKPAGARGRADRRACSQLRELAT